MIAQSVLAGLDIGSTTITASLAARDNSARVRLLALDSVPSLGVVNGQVVDGSALTAAVGALLARLRVRAPGPIERLALTVAAPHLVCRRASAEQRAPAAVLVQAGMIERVRRQAVREVCRHGVVLAVAPPCCYVDGFPLIGSVPDLYGRQVRVEQQVWLAPAGSVSERERLLGYFGVGVDVLVPRAMAAAEGAARSQERERGCVVIDIGGSSTEVAVYVDGQARQLFSLPVAGAAVTRDLAYVLGLGFDDAERLKCGGLAAARGSSRSRRAAVATTSLEIAAARAFDLMRRIRQRLDDLDLRREIGSGVIVVGGGARLAGLATVARRALELPVRIGAPVIAVGSAGRTSDPAMAAVLGLVLTQARLWPQETQDLPRIPAQPSPSIGASSVHAVHPAHAAQWKREADWAGIEWAEVENNHERQFDTADFPLVDVRPGVGPALGRWLREFVPYGDQGDDW